MMRKRLTMWQTIGIAAVLGMGSGTALAAPGADAAALRAQTTSWIKAFNSGDAKGMTAQYADDALLLPPGSPGARGKAAIMAYFVKGLADAKVSGVVFATDPQTDVGVSGNMGWESGTYKVLIKGAVVETGKFLSVSEKKGGKWHYIRDTWNADAPPPPAAPAPAPAAKK
jgi:ketosteroid isomerase-like protein